MTYTLESWLNKWLNVYKQNEIAPRTLHDYKSCINMYLYGILDKKLTKITAVQIQDCINAIQASRRKTITFQILNNAFRYALGNGLIRFNPMQAVDLKKGIATMRRAITYDEEKAILSACKSNDFRVLLIFYIETGVRRSEALTIHNSDINLQDNYIYIRGTKTENAKRLVPISARLKTVLFGFYPMSREYLFTFAKDYVTRKFKVICDRAKVKGICLHCLRHTFTTRCNEKHVDVLAVKNWLGHADIKTTMNIYTHLTKEQQEKNTIALNLATLA